MLPPIHGAVLRHDCHAVILPEHAFMPLAVATAVAIQHFAMSPFSQRELVRCQHTPNAQTYLAATRCPHRMSACSSLMQEVTRSHDAHPFLQRRMFHRRQMLITVRRWRFFASDYLLLKDGCAMPAAAISLFAAAPPSASDIVQRAGYRLRTVDARAADAIDARGHTRCLPFSCAFFF